MFLTKRLVRVVYGLVVTTATLSAGLSLRAAPSDPFTPYVPHTPPQRAQGDFDGDGRIDTALIEDRAGEARISIQLSGSSSPVDLEATVAGVVQGDVDDDGDLDLIAATPSGDVVIWINDGHGRFTRQRTSSPGNLSGEPVVDQTASRDAAVGICAPSLSSSARDVATLVAAEARHSIAERADGLYRTIVPSLRAPPAPSV